MVFDNINEFCYAVKLLKALNIKHDSVEQQHLHLITIHPEWFYKMCLDLYLKFTKVYSTY